MKEKLEKALIAVAEKSANCTTPDEALKFTQAVLNIAHALATVHNLEK